MKSLIPSTLFIAVLAAAGCGSGTVNVSGTVTYNGKPVVFGTVVLVGPDGVPMNGAIQKDGSFRISGIRTGTAKVAVTSPPPPGSNVKSSPKGGREGDDERRPADAGEKADPDVLKNWFALPEKLGDPNKSGVTAVVESGKPVTIELK